MLWTPDKVPLASHTSTTVAHRFGGGDDFSTMVGSVAESNEINHD